MTTLGERPVHLGVCKDACARGISTVGSSSMGMALLIARLALAVVFLVAAVGKLADRPGARRGPRTSASRPGSPAPWRFVLPLVEIAVALALLPSQSARWGALAAGVLLVVFSVAIAVSLARGREPDCHCFGQLHSAPAGPTVLLRNVALAAVAGFVVVGGWDDAGTSAVAWAGALSDAALVGLVLGTVLAVTVAVGGALFLGLLRQHGRVLVRLDALEALTGARARRAGRRRPASACPGPGRSGARHVAAHARGRRPRPRRAARPRHAALVLESWLWVLPRDAR